MSDIVCCKDCVYSAPSNLAGDFAELSNLVYCTYYKNNISIIRGCDNGKPKAKTNADCIRAKSDEELAEFIARQRFCAVNPIADKLGIDVTTAFIVGRKNVLDWLKQEAET